ncbi:UNVERIFIED_CONTAM: hypothetical protein FKN15_010117 [Acipenser sinensis]
MKCPSCGHVVVEEKAKFCSECGNKLQQQAQPTDSGAAEPSSGPDVVMESGAELKVLSDPSGTSPSDSLSASNSEQANEKPSEEQKDNPRKKRKKRKKNNKKKKEQEQDEESEGPASLESEQLSSDFSVVSLNENTANRQGFSSEAQGKDDAMTDTDPGAAKNELNQPTEITGEPVSDQTPNKEIASKQTDGKTVLLRRDPIKPQKESVASQGSSSADPQCQRNSEEKGDPTSGTNQREDVLGSSLLPQDPVNVAKLSVEGSVPAQDSQSSLGKTSASTSTGLAHETGHTESKENQGVNSSENSNPKKEKFNDGTKSQKNSTNSNQGNKDHNSNVAVDNNRPAKPSTTDLLQSPTKEKANTPARDSKDLQGQSKAKPVFGTQETNKEKKDGDGFQQVQRKNKNKKNKEQERMKAEAPKRMQEQQQIMPGDHLTIYFHAILSKDFNYDPEHDHIYLMGGEPLGNWETAATELHVIKKLDKHGYLIGGHLKTSKTAISKSIPYKYAVYSKKLEYETVYKWDTPKDVFVNRCLFIKPSLINEQGEWHQYDDIICAKPSEDFTRFFTLSYWTDERKRDVKKGREIAGRFILQSIFDLLSQWNEANVKNFFYQLCIFYKTYQEPWIHENTGKRWMSLQFGESEVKSLLKEAMVELVAPHLKKENQSGKVLMENPLKAAALVVVLWQLYGIAMHEGEMYTLCTLLCLPPLPKEKLIEFCRDFKETFSGIKMALLALMSEKKHLVEVDRMLARSWLCFLRLEDLQGYLALIDVDLLDVLRALLYKLYTPPYNFCEICVQILRHVLNKLDDAEFSFLDASYQMACLNYGLKVLKRMCDLAKHYWHYVAAMNSMELVIKLSAPKQNLLQEDMDGANTLHVNEVLSETLETMRNWIRNTFKKHFLTGSWSVDFTHEDEIKMWNSVISASFGSETFTSKWRTTHLKDFEGRLKQELPLSQIEIYCSKNDSLAHLNPLLASCFENCALEAVQSICQEKREVTLFESLQRHDMGKFGKLVSKIIEKSWPRNVKDELLDGYDVVINHLLNWSVAKNIFQLQDPKIIDQLTDDARQLIAVSDSVLMNISEQLVCGDIQIKHLKSILQKKEDFLTLLKIKGFPDNDEKCIDDKSMKTVLGWREEELEAVMSEKSWVDSLLKMCMKITEYVRVDVKELQRRHHSDIESMKLNEAVVVNLVDDIDNEEAGVVTYFQLNEEIRDMAGKIHTFKDSYILQICWQNEAKSKAITDPNTEELTPAPDTELTADNINKEIFEPCFQRYKNIYKNTKEGSLTLGEVDAVFETYKNRYEALRQDLVIMSKLQHSEDRRWIGRRIQQIQQYHELYLAVESAQVIIEVKQALGLNGDFTILETLLDVTHKDFKEEKLDRIDKDIIQAKANLDGITETRRRCLVELGQRKNFVNWVKEALEDINELKVFVDLASISAGENDLDVDRVACFHDAVLGYSSMLYDLKPEADFPAFMESLKKLWKALESDKDLPKKLCDTARHLEWLKTVKESHGSVELSSLSLASAINEKGIYIISSNNLKKLSLDTALELKIPEEHEGGQEMRSYSLEDLKELQNKLMLMSGKGEQGQSEVDHFAEVFSNVHRLAVSFIDLYSAGNMLFRKWEANVYCSENNQAGVIMDFHLNKTIEEIIVDGPVVEQLPEICRKMEKCLESWRVFMNEKRSQHYYLNYYTAEQIVFLCNKLSAADVDQLEDQQVMMMLSFIKPNCTATDVRKAWHQWNYDKLEKQPKKKQEVDLQSYINDIRMEVDTSEINRQETYSIHDLPVVLSSAKAADKLDLVWNFYMRDMKHFLPHCLDIGTLGELLAILASMSKPVLRSLPPGLQDGRPNLIACPHSQVLTSSICVFMSSKEEQLPTYDEVLLCTAETTYEQVQKGLSEFLFKLLVLHYLMDAEGKMWKCSNRHLYVIEILETSGEVKKQTRPGSNTPHYSFLDIFPKVFCRPPKEVLELEMGMHDSPYQVMTDPLMDDQEFRSEAFQRPFQYLKRFHTHENIDTFTSSGTEGTHVECLQFFFIYCGIVDPSWSELRNFAWFLNLQLQDCERSVFCDFNFTGDTLHGFKNFVVDFMILMAKDFATPSLSISDQSPGRQQFNFDRVTEEDLAPFRIRKKWETEPHPYIFFNDDHESMTFIGFHLQVNGNAVDAIDPSTGRVIKKNIMTPQLYEGLRLQRVPFNINFDELPREKKIEYLCHVLGVMWPMDPDETYELTTDNMLKMLAIHMRFRCGIPVIIMGETGCGKTRLIKFLCELRKCGAPTENMKLVKVHGGTTAEMIYLKVREAESISRTGKQEYGFDSVLFFDEANTTEAVSSIKEVLCDKTVEGEPLAASTGLQIVAACNPYRKHTDEMIGRLESAGLGYKVGAEETEDKLGSIPLRQLVYRVQALPPSMIPLVWDFGQLNDHTEKMYIQQIVQRVVKTIDIHVEYIPLITDVLSTSQCYMRQRKDECSFVSLRDVERCMQVFVWFYNNHEMLLQELKEFMKKEKRYGRPSDERNEIVWSLVMAVGVCYHACLEKKDKYRKKICAHLPKLYHPSKVLQEISLMQDLLLSGVPLGKTIARNNALKENVFMMVICIELRIPLFLVGKPGSSKSLAKTLVADAMQGQAAHSDLYKELKQIHLVSFQCSPHSTPEGIINTFKQCARFQEGKNLKEYVSVVVLDEIGLAEDSAKMPLKTLHPLLEEGCIDDEPLPHKKVGFVGISNWALDPAKMNRGIFVSRGDPDEKELIASAKGICSSEPMILKKVQGFFKGFAKAYLDICKEQGKEFFGLRDYYSLIKMVFAVTKSTNQEPTTQQIVEAVLRNFSGRDDVDAVAAFTSKVTMSTDMDNINPIELVRQNICADSQDSECRYLLVLTKNYAALQILQQTFFSDRSQPEIIFGSSFPKDQEYTQICRNINRVKICMETGQTIVLLNLQNLYESLYYKMSNMHSYVMFSKPLYTLWKRVQAMVIPFLAQVISLIDRDCNLDLLMDSNSDRLVKKLWMDIFGDVKLLDIPYTGVDKNSESKTILVQNYMKLDMGVCSTMPFSWRMKDYLEDLWVHALQQEGNLRFTLGHTHKQFEEFFSKTPLGRYISQANEEMKNEFCHRYLQDFLLMTMNVSSQVELEFLHKALTSCVHELRIRLGIKEEVPSLPWVHSAYHQFKKRLQNFSRMITIYPEVAELLQQRNIGEGFEMDIDVYAATACIELLEPHNLKTDESCQAWLRQVKSLQIPVELVCSEEYAQLYGDRCHALVSFVRSGWNRIYSLSLFVEHVLLGIETVSKGLLELVEEHTLKLGKCLQENSDLKSDKPFVAVVNILKCCKEEASRKFFRYGQQPCPVCLGDARDPVLLPCEHIFCHACIKQWFSPAQMYCPVCKTAIQDDFEVKVSEEIRDAVQSNAHFRNRCNAFFIDVVSTVCFKDNSPPTESIIHRLLSLLLVNNDAIPFVNKDRKFHTKALSPFDDSVDKTPVVRSVVLKLLLKYSFEKVKKYLQKHLSSVERSVLLGDEDKTELYALFINCLEDSMYENAQCFTVSEQQSLLEQESHFLRHAIGNKGSSVSVEYLQEIARIRLSLDMAANFLVEPGNSGSQLQIPGGQHKSEFLKSVKQLCEGSGNDWYRIYLARKICHLQGMEFVQQLLNNMHFRWIFPVEIVQQQHDQPGQMDRYLVCGDVYRTFRDAVGKAMIECKTEGLAEACTNCNRPADNQAVYLVLALFREVTTLYGSANQLVHPKPAQYEALIEFIKNSNILGTQELKHLADSLVRNSLETLAVRPGYPSTLQTIIELTVHTAAVLLCGKDGILAPLKQLAFVPANMQNAFLPTMPEDMMAVAQQVLGPLHWYTCPNGHPCAVGECGQPMERRKCIDCGAEMGGENHRPVQGFQRIGITGDRTQRGHVLGDPQKRDSAAMLDTREISSVPFILIRFLTHMAMLLGAAQDPQHDQPGQMDRYLVCGDVYRTFRDAVGKAMIECKTEGLAEACTGMHDSPYQVMTDPLMDDQEFRSEAFQRPFQYLKRFHTHENIDSFTSSGTEGTHVECLQFFFIYCGIVDPSWSELRNFAWFLNLQLQDCERSVFCDFNFTGDTLQGFKNFVVDFMILMAKDFATPSLSISDQSPGRQQFNFDRVTEEDLAPFRIRKKWETEPHPYIFFNDDHESMTFIGFHLQVNGNAVDAIDPSTGRVIKKNIMTPQLYEGLRLQRVPFNINFDELPREKKIQYLCHVLGVPCAVGECGQPMERRKCIDCGAEMGGENHRPVQGFQRIGITGDRTQRGHVLGDPQKRDSAAMLDTREISSVPFILIRFLTHMAMLLGAAQDPQSIAQIIKPVVPNPAQFLLAHLMKDLDQLTGSLGKGMDDTANTVHLLLCNLMEQHQHQWPVRYDATLSTKEKRNGWETAIASSVITPELKKLERQLKEVNEQIRNDKRISSSPVVKNSTMDAELKLVKFLPDLLDLQRDLVKKFEANHFPVVPNSEIKIPEEYCSRDLKLDSDFPVLLPRRQGLGLCSTALDSENILDTTSLVRSCVQSAVGMLRDQYEGTNRSTKRVQILLTLLAEDKELNASFLKTMKRRLYTLLARHDENSPSAKNWVFKEATNIDALQEGGTFSL